MKILKTIQEYLVMLGIKPNELNRLNWKSMTGFLVYSLFICSNIMFILSIDDAILMDYVKFFCTMSVLVEITICVATIALQQTKLFEVIESIEKLINERLKYAKSKSIYEDTNRHIEKISGILCVVFVKVMPSLVIWPTFMISFVNYLTTDLGGDSFDLPLSMWLPFNWHCPIGYLTAITLQWILYIYICFTAIMPSIIGIGAYLFIIEIINETTNILKSIDENSKKKRKHQHIYKQFAAFINLHAAIKQIVSDFAGLYQPIYMVVFSQSLSIICCVMLILQMELITNGNRSAELAVLGLSGFITFIVVLIVSELGQRISNAFDEIKESIGQFHWYRFPNDMKRILPMVMIVAQKPVSVDCFGSFSCYRESFKKVLNGAYKYFMVLRKFVK